MKEEGYKQYIEWHKKNKNISNNEIRAFIEEIIENKINAIL